MTPNSSRAALLLALALTPACAQILAIEDAQVDATFGGPAPSAGSAGKPSSGGSGNASGNAAASAGAHHEPAVGGRPDSAIDDAAGEATGGANPAVAGTGGAAPEQSLCEQYCREITDNCQGKYEQYRTFDQCVQVCKRLPAGEPGDEGVNSVSCRLRQAEFSASEPFVYCKSAGPLGSGKCGSNCVSYCSLMQVTCTAGSTTGNLELSYFESADACVTACGELPPVAGAPAQYSSSASAEPSSFIGNTVFCRTYHVAAALEQDTPDEHCPHAMGGDPCLEQ